MHGIKIYKYQWQPQIIKNFIPNPDNPNPIVFHISSITIHKNPPRRFKWMWSREISSKLKIHQINIGVTGAKRSTPSSQSSHLFIILFISHSLVMLFVRGLTVNRTLINKKRFVIHVLVFSFKKYLQFKGFKLPFGKMSSYAIHYGLIFPLVSTLRNPNFMKYLLYLWSPNIVNFNFNVVLIYLMKLVVNLYFDLYHRLWWYE